MKLLLIIFFIAGYANGASAQNGPGYPISEASSSKPTAEMKTGKVKFTFTRLGRAKYSSKGIYPKKYWNAWFANRDCYARD